MSADAWPHGPHQKPEGIIAYGPPLTDDEIERVDREGHALFESSDPREILVGALFIRLARLERERRHA